MTSNRFIRAIENQITDLDSKTLKRVLKTIQGPNDVILKIDGKDILSFCSNDYLGLSNHPDIKSAIKTGLDHFGIGSGASHLISGHSQAHVDLEKKLASFQAASIPQAKALFLITGYMANLACITALCASHENTLIYSDELNHASLIDGIRLAGAQSHVEKHIYPHDDLVQLESLLSTKPVANNQNTLSLIVTDGVFSMDGDMADVKGLLHLAQKYDALLLIDDAHGFGVLGTKGYGILEENDISSDRIIYMGTLGKAAGISGAFIVAHESITEWIIQKARSYIYTTAAPPALSYGLLTSLNIIDAQDGAKRRVHLNHLITYFKKNITLKRWKVVSSNTPIQPIIIGSNEEALKITEELKKLGLYIPAIRPPTVPVNTARLRITFSAAHSIEQVQYLINSLHQIEAELESI